MVEGKCAYCGKTKPLTRDHVIPAQHGGKRLLDCGVSNIKMACLGCNNARAQANHCTGVMLMARSLERQREIGDVRTILRRWGFDIPQHVYAKIRRGRNARKS